MTKALKLLILILAVSMVNHCTQAQFIQFYNYADSEAAFCIRETSDSCYIIAIGGGVNPDIGAIVKTDGSGNVMWQDIDQSPVASANFVTENINGDYTLLEEQQNTSSPNIVLRRYTSNGTLIFSKDSFIYERSGGGSFVENSSDSSLTIVGTKHYGGGIPARSLFIQCDQFGDTLFTREISDSLHLQCYGIVKGIDSGYILSCRKFSQFNSKIRSTVIIKVDTSGNELWRRELKQTVINGNDILKNFDNNLYALCYHNFDSISNSYTPASAFYDINGDTIAINDYSQFGNSLAHSMVQRSQEGYIVLTNAYNNGIIRLLYTDSLGAVSCTKEISDSVYHLMGYSMISNHQGQLAICGTAYNNVQFVYNSFLTVVDSNCTNFTSIVNHNTASCKFNIYPNPSYGNVSVFTDCQDNKEFSQLRITDLSGRMVFSYKIKDRIQENFDLNNLQTGVYILELVGNTNIITKRFIKL